jgi:hypothetical protein
LGYRPTEWSARWFWLRSVRLEVSVKLQPKVAEAVDRPEARTAAASAFLGAVEALGVPLQPVHPGHADPELRTYYRVEVPDEQAAEQVRNALAELEGVEAAYVQPPAALP